jgi:prepilin-type processing-associated H-X9-DG protein
MVFDFSDPSHVFSGASVDETTRNMLYADGHVERAMPSQDVFIRT